MSEHKKPELSVILPSIRPERLPGFYKSLCESTSLQFELIVVGPNPLPEELLQYRNIKYVRDFGHPTRAQNIALLVAEGEIVTWQADDAIMLPGSIDANMKILREMGGNPLNVVIAKYQEGQVGSTDRDRQHDDSYFKIAAGPAASPYLPPDWWLFNVAFMHRSFLEALGGFNSEFEGTWSSQTDLAIRAQTAGAVVKMSGIPCMICDHMPGTSGDHEPIYNCQTFHDEPLLHAKYRNNEWSRKESIAVEVMNWKNVETVWTRRFK